MVMGAFGLALGFSLSCIGFADWGEVHRMFTFADLRLVLTFGGAVLVTAIGFLLLRPNGPTETRPVHRGTVLGAVLFGASWAISGACPAVTLVQLGEGQVIALLTLAGVFVGTRIHDFARPRWLRWDRGGGCGG
jgi:uncharacterized membrane protein YedE/YeeE